MVSEPESSQSDIETIIANELGIDPSLAEGVYTSFVETPPETALEVVVSPDPPVHYARGRNPKSLSKLQPFVKGDPRINRAGRPRTRDELRRLVQRLSDQPDPEQPNVSRLEAMLLTMLSEGTASDREHILWYGFGRPAIEIKDGRRGKLVEELSDEELAEFILEEVERRRGSGPSGLEGPGTEGDPSAQEEREEADGQTGS